MVNDGIITTSWKTYFEKLGGLLTGASKDFMEATKRSIVYHIYDGWITIDWRPCVLVQAAALSARRFICNTLAWQACRYSQQLLLDLIPSAMPPRGTVHCSHWLEATYDNHKHEYDHGTSDNHHKDSTDNYNDGDKAQVSFPLDLVVNVRHPLTQLSNSSMLMLRQLCRELQRRCLCTSRTQSTVINLLLQKPTRSMLQGTTAPCWETYCLSLSLELHLRQVLLQKSTPANL